MTQANGSDLSEYYRQIQARGNVLTPTLAEQWSKAVLWTLSQNLDSKTKKQLANALPDELARALKRPFWLVKIRDKNKSRQEFFKEVARRGGNTDPSVARYPTTAVFHALKGLAGQDVSDKVAESLPIAVRELWEQA